LAQDEITIPVIVICRRIKLNIDELSPLPGRGLLRSNRGKVTRWMTIACNDALAAAFIKPQNSPTILERTMISLFKLHFSLLLGFKDNGIIAQHGKICKGWL